MALVEFEKNGAIGFVTLNDAERLNAMSVAMGQSFLKLVKTIGKDKDLRVVVLTGAGRAFSSGGNLDMITGLMDKPKPFIAKQLKAFYKMFLEIREIPQIVISAINGPAVGAGFCLAMAGDLKYALRGAKMGANFAKLGLAPGMAGTYLMTRLAGPVHASEILLTGKIFDTDAATRFGLLNGVFEPQEFLTRVQNVAEEIAANAPLALKQIKKGIQLAQTRTMEQMFDYDARMQALCLNTKDIKEGISAVKEKRAPRFLGK